MPLLYSDAMKEPELPVYLKLLDYREGGEKERAVFLHIALLPIRMRCTQLLRQQGFKRKPTGARHNGDVTLWDSDERGETFIHLFNSTWKFFHSINLGVALWLYSGPVWCFHPCGSRPQHEVTVEYTDDRKRCEPVQARARSSETFTLLFKLVVGWARVFVNTLVHLRTSASLQAQEFLHPVVKCPVRAKTAYPFMIRSGHCIQLSLNGQRGIKLALGMLSYALPMISPLTINIINQYFPSS